MFFFKIPMTIVVHLGYSTWINLVRILPLSFVISSNTQKFQGTYSHELICHELDLFLNWFDFPLWHKGNVVERRLIPFWPMVHACFRGFILQPHLECDNSHVIEHGQQNNGLFQTSRFLVKPSWRFQQATTYHMRKEAIVNV